MIGYALNPRPVPKIVDLTRAPYAFLTTQGLLVVGTLTEIKEPETGLVALLLEHRHFSHDRLYGL